MMKKDPSEEGEVLAPTSPTSPSAPNSSVNGNINEQTMIKANKGMILRKVRPRALHIHRVSDVLNSRSSIFDTSNSLCRCRLRGEETWKSVIGCWSES